MQSVGRLAILNLKQESRVPAASSDGGKQCRNKQMVKTIRAIGKQIVKQIGRQVLTGSFNLNAISFPIRAMIPKSALEKALSATCLFPLYINKAVQSKDPIERIKLVICATIGSFYLNCSFLKPLNPVLGETIEAHYADTTKLYAEQISHHPPVSYFHVIGPHSTYQFYGFYNYEAKAGLNSLVLKNRGKRFIKFADQLIEYNYGSEEYSGSFWGPMKVEVTGKMHFIDRIHNLSAELEFNDVRWKPTDYFQGEIKFNGKRVSKIYGSYMGYIEFDTKRYWDYEHIQPYQLIIDQPNEFLLSDHQFRPDRKLLLKSKVDEAQKEKEQIEVLQRADAKLRKHYITQPKKTNC